MIFISYFIHNQLLNRILTNPAKQMETLGTVLEKRQKILVVDDYHENLELIEKFFINDSYEIIKASNGFEAISLIDKNPPDLILLDIIMPGIDGFEVCKRLKENPITHLIPIIMITALEDSDAKIKGIELGVNDFITKPIQLLELRARVASLLNVKKYTDELESAEKMIFSLALAVEAKNQYTAGHCNRLSKYGAILGRKLGLSDKEIKTIRRGAYLHDIGKIGINDEILLKPGPLDPKEFAIIKEHPLIGEKICEPLKSLRPVLPIIRSHQERFNGSGYPDGLAQSQIPIIAHIVAIVDCFDALTTDRPYRKALTKEESITVIHQETIDGLWDPDIVNIFESIVKEEEIEK